MLRHASLFAAAGFMAVLAAPASAESFTTRIEPRQFYGATVTLEEGVRVFRPLPPTRQVIINPNGSTPLALSFQDVRVTEEVHNYAPAMSPDVQGSAGPTYFAPAFPPHFFARGFHRGVGRVHSRLGGVPAFGHAR